VVLWHHHAVSTIQLFNQYTDSRKFGDKYVMPVETTPTLCLSDNNMADIRIFEVLLHVFNLVISTAAFLRL
jgi:hypothetical protein